MQKEIFEQPRAVADTLEGHRAALGPELFGVDAAEVLAERQRGHRARLRHQLPCRHGRALLAGGDRGHTAQRRDRQRVPLSAERSQPQRAGGHHLAVRRDGRHDRCAQACQVARAHRDTLAICNVPKSAMVRQTQLAFLTRAGPEIGVASTKAFTTQLAALFLLTLVLAKLRGRLTRGGRGALAAGAAPPAQRDPGGAGARADDHRLGRALRRTSSMRCSSAAGCTTRSRWKARSSSRKSPTSTPRPTPPGSSSTGRWRWWIATCRWWRSHPTTRCWRSSSPICRKCARAAASSTSSPTPTATSESAKASTFCGCPSTPGCCSPILHTVPLQLLAYHAALVRGTDVDKPRNLAKSVTVE